MTNAVAERSNTQADIVEQVVIGGDLGRLSAEQRVMYYRQVCESVGLNPLTRPFDYLVLNGKLTLYANRGASDQLRRLRQISIEKVEREELEGLFVVTVYAKDKDGRVDTAIGAVPIEGLKGEAKANAMMKAETKAKRRLTLSLAGLGWLDESEVDTIPAAARADVDPETGEVLRINPAARPVGGQTNEVAAAPAGELEPLSSNAVARLPAVPKDIRTVTSLGAGGNVTGYVKVKETPPSDGQLRQSPEGYRIGFVLEMASGQRIAQVEVRDDLAEALAERFEGDLRGLVDTEVNLTGELFGVPWKKDGEAKPPFYRLKVSRILTREWELPAVTPADPEPEVEAAAEPEKPKRQTKAQREAAAEAAVETDDDEPTDDDDAPLEGSLGPIAVPADTRRGISYEDFAAALDTHRISPTFAAQAAKKAVGSDDLKAITPQQRHEVATGLGLYDEP